MESDLPKKRATLTKEAKRLLAEQSTAFAFQEAERHRLARDQKTARLRALRLAQNADSRN